MTSHTTDQDTAVRSSIHVTATPEHAFEVFTNGIDRWWPRAHHVQPGELRQVGLDPHVGGRMWEENDAGEVCAWGRVLTWEPPRAFAFSWLIGPDWKPPAADAVGSRVTVTFTPTDTGTRVDLVHDQLDAHGPGWEGVRDAVGSDGGWPGSLRDFADAL
ncbi:SRPBCC family protein [Micromonospora phytophila]|uniref:SRPBCC family protein n=1 Tax=Micromonospora phytophila TaxID=709888 RepID=UPI00202F0653|nr:SRPBCC family protein [Micromonospora phytophila]MCM0673845.1 SRPBCC family protein [Micromonospora phytophila]